MRILVDECAPKALALALLAAGFDCKTVQEVGWSGKQNGELLALANTTFDVLITIDQNLRYQQSLSGKDISMIVIRARSNRLADLQQHFPACLDALQHIKPGTIVEIGG